MSRPDTDLLPDGVLHQSAEMAAALKLAREAGALARAHWKPDMARQWKADGSPVTDTDIAINRRVIEEITAQFPGHAVLGEEESSGAMDAEWLWVCDPLDGTVPFAHGIPVSAFSLALTQNGVPQIAVVYDFHSDRLLTAARGEGAYLNGQRIRVAERTQLAGAVIDVEALWSRGTTVRQDLSALPSHLEAQNVRLLKLGSTVYAGMLVASGAIAGLITRGDKPWDIAAIALLVQEAGGTATDLWGEPLRCNQSTAGTILAGPGLHPVLLACVRDSQAPIRNQ